MLHLTVATTGLSCSSFSLIPTIDLHICIDLSISISIYLQYYFNIGYLHNGLPFPLLVVSCVVTVVVLYICSDNQFVCVGGADVPLRSATVTNLTNAFGDTVTVYDAPYASECSGLAGVSSSNVVNLCTHGLQLEVTPSLFYFPCMM